MIHRELNAREREILLMIKRTTFQDMVDEVRKDYDDRRYARKHLMNLNHT